MQNNKKNKAITSCNKLQSTGKTKLLYPVPSKAEIRLQRIARLGLSERGLSAKYLARLAVIKQDILIHNSACSNVFIPSVVVAVQTVKPVAPVGDSTPKNNVSKRIIAARAMLARFETQAGAAGNERLRKVAAGWLKANGANWRKVIGEMELASAMAVARLSNKDLTPVLKQEVTVHHEPLAKFTKFGQISYAGGDSFDAPIFESKKDLKQWQKTITNSELSTAISAANSLAEKLEAIGQWAAWKARGSLLHWYGINPSETSLFDAAADSVARIVTVLNSELYLIDGKPAIESAMSLFDAPRTVANGKKGNEFTSALLRAASATAWNSLRSWSNDGLSGRNANDKRGERKPVFKTEITIVNDNEVSDALDKMREHLSESTKSVRGDAENMLAIRRIYRAGYYALKASLEQHLAAYQAELPRCKLIGCKPSLAPIRPVDITLKLKAAQKRCRAMAELIRGESLRNACFLAGYRGNDTVQDFQESCASADFFHVIGIAGALRDSSAADEMASRLNAKGAIPVSFHAD